MSSDKKANGNKKPNAHEAGTTTRQFVIVSGPAIELALKELIYIADPLKKTAIKRILEQVRIYIKQDKLLLKINKIITNHYKKAAATKSVFPWQNLMLQDAKAKIWKTKSISTELVLKEVKEEGILTLLPEDVDFCIELYLRIFLRHQEALNVAKTADDEAAEKSGPKHSQQMVANDSQAGINDNGHSLKKRHPQGASLDDDQKKRKKQPQEEIGKNQVIRATTQDPSGDLLNWENRQKRQSREPSASLPPPTAPTQVQQTKPTALPGLEDPEVIIIEDPEVSANKNTNQETPKKPAASVPVAATGPRGSVTIPQTTNHHQRTEPPTHRHPHQKQPQKRAATVPPTHRQPPSNPQSPPVLLPITRKQASALFNMQMEAAKIEVTRKQEQLNNQREQQKQQTLYQQEQHKQQTLYQQEQHKQQLASQRRVDYMKLSDEALSLLQGDNESAHSLQVGSKAFLQLQIMGCWLRELETQLNIPMHISVATKVAQTLAKASRGTGSD